MTTEVEKDSTISFHTGHFPNGVNHPFLTLTAYELQNKFGGEKGIFHNPEQRDIARNLTGIIRLLTTGCGFKSLRGKVVMDVGCGTGLVTGPLCAAVFSPESEGGIQQGCVIATEISTGFLELCHKRASLENWQNVRFIHTPDGIHFTGVESGSVDLVLICDVYHHFEKPHATMTEVRRVLKLDGVVVLIDFHRDVTKCWSHPENPNWPLEHLRADQSTFEGEILSCGFKKLGERHVEGLNENYIVLFQVNSSQ
jgi:ubiquinone/menaquinone biosynthesis C-methylase UbiE